jgi:hypothetical protein
MGEVYEADDLVLHTRVAIKLLSQFGPAQLFQFKQEFRSLADAVHPNLVGLHELHCEGEQWFFSMELVEGGDFAAYVRGEGSHSGLELDERLSDTVEAAGPAGPAESEGAASSVFTGHPLWELGPDAEVRLRKALTGLATGVAALHDFGRVHRDLKPSNVLVTAAGRAVILDFGLVSSRRSAGRAGTELVSGTIPYMSPEQAGGDSTGPASDWYSVGVMLYEVLAGRLPYGGTFSEMLAAKRRAPQLLPALDGRVPADLADLCRRLLSPRPEDRPDGRAVLSLLDAGGAARGETTIGGGPSSPLVGRTLQLGMLRTARQLARPGHSCVAWVSGRSGMGKTALLQAFLAEAEGEGALVLSSRCSERESVPYKGVDGVVDRLAGYLAGLPSGHEQALMPRHLGALQQLFPVLSLGPGGEGTHRGPIPVDPRENQRRAFGALRELLCRLGDLEELVLAIDDLQWSDGDSARLVSELLRPPDAPTMLLILAHRSEASGRVLDEFHDAVRTHVPEEHTVRVDLGPLPLNEAEQVARFHCGPPGEASAERARFVAAESQGIPFFIEELARAAAAAPEAGGRLLSLDEYTRTRVRGLAVEPRGLLEVLAVAGQPLPQSLAWRAAGCASMDTEVLKLLAGNHLLRTLGAGPEGLLECYHDRIREAVVAGLDEERRSAHHLALAMCWEGWGIPDHEAVARHYLLAGHGERAAQFARRAAGAAARALAFDRAADLYRMSLANGVWGDEDVRSLLSGLGDVLGAAGRGKEAADVYLDLAGRCSGEVEWTYLGKAADQLLAAGHVVEGRQVMQRVLSRFGLSMPGGQLATLWSLAWLSVRKRVMGLRYRARPEAEIPRRTLDRIDTCRSAALSMGMADPMRSAVFQQRALIFALQAGEPSRVARQLAAEGGYAAAFGGRGYARSLELLVRARQLALSISDPEALSTCHACLAIAMFQLGRWADAVAQAEEGERLCLERGLHAGWEIYTCRLFRIGPRGWMGRYRDFRSLASELLADAVARHDFYSAAHVRLGSPIHPLLIEDRPDACRDGLKDAAAFLSESEFTLYHVYASRLRCQIAMYRGGWEEAVGVAEAVRKGVERSIVGRVALARNFMLEALGGALVGAAGGSLDKKTAAHRIDRCIRTARKIGLPWLDGLATTWEGGALLLAGRSAEAAAAYGRAASIFEGAHMHAHVAACRYRQGGLEGGDAGRTLQAVAVQYLRDETVANPERLVATLVPSPQV